MQWLIINPTTFIWIKKRIGLIYDSDKFISFTFKLNSRISEICNELLCPSNLNATVIKLEDLNNENTYNWISELVFKYKLGKLIDGTKKKPITLSPILKLQNDVSFYKYEHSIGNGGSILNNIHELYFYINPSTSGSHIYFKQLPYPHKKCPTLNMNQILQFVKSCINPFLSEVCLVGNLFTYPHYKRFVNQMLGLVKNIKLNMTYADLISHKTQLLELSVQYNISVSVLFDCSQENFWEFREFTFPMEFIFLTFSEFQYEQLSQTLNEISEYHEVKIVPVFEGENLNFFEEYVFTSEEDIATLEVTRREIFIHQSLNSNDFGKIFILPNGNVHTNVNIEPVGNIDDSPYSIVYKEMTEGNSWLRIRNQQPCTNCIYQWLCPSPSNYELVIGKPNLCHINSDTF
ncbi:TIGR04150 pseudo-rSAM protein [Draconibacterium orientale]|uniref:TIGR04150 pseudo-rSAM protein n=1 Tax=Draconibacterium orientale TaxID=1168034 RepID=UPI0029C07C45|nr:TIGR04150 pseudo-rSAM protein [Draconibacterium orientale]